MAKFTYSAVISTPMTEKPRRASSRLCRPNPQAKSRILSPPESPNVFTRKSTCLMVSSTQD